MEIIDFEYRGPYWEIAKIKFQKTNLVVGDSGTGKTRLLNAMFNLGTGVAQKKLVGVSNFKLSIKVEEDLYTWEIDTVEKDEKILVRKEVLILNEELIVDRSNNKFVYSKKEMPRLPRDEMSISILREEEVIEPLYSGFSKMLRRKFFEDDLKKNTSIVTINIPFLERIGKSNDLFELYKADLPLNPRLYLLSKYFPNIYGKIINYYRETFEFVEKLDVLDSTDLGVRNVPGVAPIFCIMERGVDKWLRLDELSSGMQKVLLILTDLLSLPSGNIYLIDEYENSLGVGAINFLPDFLQSEKMDRQIIFTSHHPYIISNIPSKHWYVAHRTGTKVQFAYGEELVQRYGISKQEKYIQLLNDPFYSEGID